MAVKYLRLFDPTQQFQLKGGQLNVAGRLYVHLESTDDLAALYDENGSQLSQPVILDNNGRAAGLFVNAAQTYWLDVQDQYGMSQFTIRKMTPCGGGGGSLLGNTYDVVSSDGSIDIDKFDNAGVTTFDIGIAPNDSDEFLEWVKCSDEDISNGVLYPTFVDGTMEVYAANGLHVGKDKFYHITCTIKVDPTGSGINYETLSANLKFSDGSDHDLVRRNYDIDNSVNDPCLCEFSYDFKAPADGYLYLLIEGVNTFEQVDCELQVHRIYSGINAVPDTCATKQWVEQTFDMNLSSKVDYSAIEYNQYNEITGISGSAIAAGTIDSAFVSSVASSYAESAVSSISGWSGYFSSISSKVDQSAFDDCCSAVHSALDDKLDKSASGQFAPSGDYAYNSSLSDYIPTSASGMFQPSGDYQSAGDYAFNSSVSSKLDASASGDFVLNSSFSSYSSNVGDTINNMSSSITSIENNITSISSDVSGKVDETAMSAWIPYSALEYSGTAISGISGSSLVGGADYSGVAPVNVDNDSRLISVDHRTLCVDSTMTAYNSGSSAVIGVNVAGLDLSSKMDASASSLFYPNDNPSGFITGVDLTPYQLTADMSAYAHESSLSSKLDASASSEFYSTSNPSGFLTAHQSLAGYATESYVDSAVSGKMDKSESSSFYPMDSNPSGYLTAHQSLAGYATETYVDSSVSGKLDATAYNSAEFYTTANPSGFITGVDLTPYQLTADMSAYQLSGDYAYNSAVSAKLDASASSEFQPSGDYYSATNPSGFITGVDLTPYQLTADMSGYYTTANESGFVDSAYVEGQVSGKQDASAMTAYQEVSDMTAYQPAGDYQPSGDYIYVSALGWAEV